MHFSHIQNVFLLLANFSHFKKSIVLLPPDEKEERIYVKLPTSLKNALNNNLPYAVFFSEKKDTAFLIFSTEPSGVEATGTER